MAPPNPSPRRTRVALLCSGAGHVLRGHEIFARDLFELLRDDVDLTLVKGGGEPAPGEVVVPCVWRDSPLLDRVRVNVSPSWQSARQEEERLRIEHETFAYAALPTLLEGGYDIIHCLEQEVCNVVFDNRHLFRHTPKVLFSNGGAIPSARLPRCDFVQEHTRLNFARSDQSRAFLIPHGVDVERFRPGLPRDLRRNLGIPDDAFVLISVGTLCVHHKRMDHVIREVASVPGNPYLLLVGEENQDTAGIKALGREMLGERVIFTRMPHDQLPLAYAAADAFVLGSLFETFGIVYIEAMAMGLPVFCTSHPNQRQIVQEGVFVDMARPGVLAHALRTTSPQRLRELGLKGRQIAEEQYDLRVLRAAYLHQFAIMASSPDTLPRRSLKRRLLEKVERRLANTLALIRRI